MAGPDNAKEICSAPVPRPVSASSFRARRPVKALADRPPALDYADVPPKVCAAFHAPPGKPPRRVRVERLRRLYQSQDVAALLRARGVDYADPTFDSARVLPLEPFDDTEYDVRTPAEWMALAFHPETGVPMPLSGQALCTEPEYRGQWRKALIHRHDDGTGRFEISWADESKREEDEVGVPPARRFWVPRLQLVFDAEDPVAFADRVAGAHNARQAAEALIRYNFFIDNMPIDDVQQLAPEQADRLLEAVENPEFTGQGTEAILGEVQLDFARTMNRVTFDVHILRDGGSSDIAALNLREPAANGPVGAAMLGIRPPTPLRCLALVPAHNFADTFAAFCFTTLRVRSEVVLTLQGIQAACYKLLTEERVFYTDFERPQRLDEFRQAMRAAAAGAGLQIKQAWTTALQQIVLREFAHIGKGWFNIAETSKDLYKIGKMRRLLTLVRFLMQTTLRCIAKSSVEAYVAAVERAAPLETNVESLSQVSCEYREVDSGRHTVPGPVFHTEVLRRDGQDGDPKTFTFSVDPQRFVQASMEAFNTGVSLLNEVQTLERLVVPQFAKLQGAAQFVTAFDPSESWVRSAAVKLEGLVSSCLDAPQQYLELVQEHTGLLNREAAAHVEAFAESKVPAPTDAEVQDAIIQEQDEEEELLRALPEQIGVGLFQINCKDVRRQLAAKHSQVVTLLLDVLVRRLRAQMSDTTSDFQGIIAQLQKVPKNIEELVEMKYYALSVPAKVEAMQAQIARDVALYERIEGFRHRLTLEDMKRRWQLAAAPAATLHEVTRKLKLLSECETDFVKKMGDAQVDFEGHLDDFQQTIDLFRLQPMYRDTSRLEWIIEIVENVNGRLAAAEQQARLLNSREGLLGKPRTDYQRLKDSTKAFEAFSGLWQAVSSWRANRFAWKNGDLKQIDAAELERAVCGGAAKLEKVCAALRSCGAHAEVTDVAEQTFRELEDFRPFVPVIVALRTEGMQERHWSEVSLLVGQRVNPNMPGFTLTNLCSESYNLQGFIEPLARIAERAAQEHAIEKQLGGLRAEWDNINFDCAQPYRNTGTYILKGVDEVASLLDEQLAAAQQLSFSPFKGDLSDDIDKWVAQLRYMLENLDEWRRFQRSWLHLQPIFESVDVVRQLPTESRRFKANDSLWRSVMKATHDHPKALDCLSEKGRLDRWATANQGFEVVKRSLEDYLAAKRSQFCRFYFLSSEELIQVISHTKEPKRVQPLFRHMFEGVGQVLFQQHAILGVTTPTSEELVFVRPIGTRESTTEAWLLKVEAALSAAVRSALQGAVASCSTAQDRGRWALQQGTQALLAAVQVHWAADVEGILSAEGDLESYLDRLDRQLQAVIDMIRSPPPQSAYGARNIVASLSALAVVEALQKEVVARLVADSVVRSTAFGWQCRLRCTWVAEEVQGVRLGGLWVKTMHGCLPYGNEALADPARVVVTPETDRCFMAMLGALLLNLGGAVAGPPSAGKTETIKDLAKVAGRSCVTYSCAAGFEPSAAGRLMMGCAGVGFWCCLEELTGAAVEVLGVLAQQLSTLLHAKAPLLQAGDWTGAGQIDHDGVPASVRASFNIYLAVGFDHVDRAGFPDDFRRVLRPIALVQNDPAMVAEVMLLAMGFRAPGELARRLASALHAAQERVPWQRHYDWGLRVLRAVVEAMPAHKQAIDAAAAATAAAVAAARGRKTLANLGEDGSSELKAAAQAMREVVRPQLLEQDMRMFEAIVGSAFNEAPSSPTNAMTPLPDTLALHAQIERACGSLQLQPTPAFIAKAVQLHRAWQARRGVALVGPPGGGKTSLTRVLQCCARKMGGANDDYGHFPSFAVHVLNPLAVSLGTLYGHFDSTSREWKDGILGEVVKQVLADATGEKHWIVLDGPIDAGWSDSLTTAFDQSRVLCLGAETIRLTPQVTLAFETDDLHAASPSTVARCAVVFMEPSAAGLRAQVASWLLKLPVSLMTLKLRWEHLLLYLALPLIAYVNGPDVDSAFPSTEGGLLTSLLNLLDILLVEHAKREPPPEVEPTHTPVHQRPQSGSSHGSRNSLITSDAKTPTSGQAMDRVTAHGQTRLDQLFLFAVAWSVCATCDKLGRHRASDEVRRLCQQVELDARCYQGGADLYDSAYQPQNGAWTPWVQLMPQPVAPLAAGGTGPAVAYEHAIVPTEEMACLSAMLAYLLPAGRHVVVAGPSGSLKTSGVIRYLATWEEQCRTETQRLTHSRFALSAHTSARDLQTALEDRLERRRRGVYGPLAGCRAAFFIDDLNMPRQQAAGAQPPLELVRQWLDHGGFHHKREGRLCKIVDLVAVGAAGPAGQGGRQAVSRRVARHFHCLSTIPLEEDTLEAIFAALLARFGPKPPPGSDARPHMGRLASATISAFLEAQKQFKPTPRAPHLHLGFRDLWRAVQGLCCLDADADLNVRRLARAWYHECFRTFGDGVPGENQRGWLRNQLLDRCFENFSQTEDVVLRRKRLLFASGIDNPEYREVTDLEAYRESMGKLAAEQAAMQGVPQTTVMFLDACEHVSRICRVLRLYGGHCLLLGQPGSGRRSMAQLAAFASGHACVTPKASNLTEWRKEVKACLMQAGLQGLKQTFLLCDTQVFEEEMLEDVNRLVDCGDLLNLYQGEDMESIMQACTATCIQQGLQATPTNIIRTFVQRVRAELHFVLVFRAPCDKLAARLREFPAIAGGCTVDWFGAWPAEALQEIAEAYLPAAPAPPPAEEGHRPSQSGTASLHHSLLPPGAAARSALVAVLPRLHTISEVAAQRRTLETGRHSWVTPSSYLEMLHIFRKALEEIGSKNKQSHERLSLGVQRLDDAHTAEQQLTAELEELKPRLEAVREQSQTAAGELAKVRDEAAAKRAIVQAAQLKAEQVEEECRDREREANQAIAEAMPQVEEAMEALKKLHVSQVREIKTMAKPSPGVLATMSAVCMLQGVAPMKKPGPRPNSTVDDYWQVVTTQLLREPKKFLEDMLVFDRDTIRDEGVQKVLPMVGRDDFDPAAIRKTSIAAEALNLWCRAMCKYHEVRKYSEPRRQLLAAALATFEAARAALEEAAGQLDAVEQRVETATQELQRLFDQEQDLEQRISTHSAKAARARRLLAMLNTERLRWAEGAAQLRAKGVLLPSDLLICATLAVHGGALERRARGDLEQRALKCLREADLAHTLPSPSLRKILGDPRAICDWHGCGLAEESFLVDNAIIINTVRRWPLIVDPQGQAGPYLKGLGRAAEKTSEAAGLDVLVQASVGLLAVLAGAMEFGRWVIIEQTDEPLSPIYDALLDRRQVETTKGLVIHIGDRAVPVNPSFRLFMTTGVANIQYTPEFLGQVALVNFAVTEASLREVLLAEIAARERADLERRRRETTRLALHMRQEMADTEQEMLRILCTGEGDILEDESVVTNLSSAMEVSAGSAAKLSEWSQVQADCEQERRIYEPIAACATAVFLTLQELPALCASYHFSLRWYLDLLGVVILEYKGMARGAARLHQLSSQLVAKAYSAVAQGLLQEHRLVFGLRLILRTHAPGAFPGALSGGGAELEFLCGGTRPHAHFASTTAVAPAVAPAALPSIAEQPGAPERQQAAPGVPGGGAAADPAAAAAPNMSLVQAEPSYLPAAERAELAALEKVPGFRGLVFHLSGPERIEWQAWCAAEAPEEIPFPGRWEHELMSPLQRLCLLRAVRPDRVPRAALAVVRREVGDAYQEVPSLSISGALRNTPHIMPVLFVLSNGVDPVAEVRALARAQVRDGAPEPVSFQKVCLAPGQEARAMRALQTAAADGGWVMLCNCHLHPEWLPELEQFCDTLSLQQTHRDFRLWLTSTPDATLPTALLHRCAKLAVPCVTGLRASLIHIYEALTEEEALGGPSDHEFLRRFIFGLVLLHAVVLELCASGTGWSSPHVFRREDLDHCMRQLTALLREGWVWEAPPSEMETVARAVAIAGYGGHFVQVQDVELLDKIADLCLAGATTGVSSDGDDDLFENKSWPWLQVSTKEELMEALRQAPLPEFFISPLNAEEARKEQVVKALFADLAKLQAQGQGQGHTSEGPGAAAPPAR